MGEPGVSAQPPPTEARSYWVVWYRLPMLTLVGWVCLTIVFYFGVVLFLGYAELDVEQRILLAAAVIVFGSGALWLLYGLLRFAFRGRLAAAAVEFLATTRRWRVPVQDLRVIKVSSANDGNPGLGVVEFQHLHGTARAWELRHLSDLIARLQARNPEIVVSRSR